jgi:hypothetical protein
MQYSILLDRNENTREVEIQEQARFVKSILEALQIPIEWNPEEPFSVESKIRFRKELDQFKINIIDDSNGGIKIYVETDLIAEWHKPLFKLKKDSSQIDPRKQIYLEMNVRFSSLFEEDI